MCGITGIFETRERKEISRAVLARMNESQHHRGPDEVGYHIEPGVGLGHRRLSIIAVATGQQPLFNEDGSVAVIYNGEIYNFQELIPELTALGHTFRTKSDTEVIVHAWEAWGEACVKRFRGMFAFALWDRNRSTLFLARDRLGVKPLYYALLADGTFIFGSELKSLLASTAGCDATSIRCAVEEYFALGYVPEPRTIFTRGEETAARTHADDSSRRAGSRAVAILGPEVHARPAVDLEDAMAELTARVDESVRLRLISEVPLGAFLSGGVDSSTVVAAMAGASPTPVNTCSISFADPAFDESRYASQVAQRYGTRHFVDRVESDDFDLIDVLARLYDEPFADSSAIPTYRVCQLARKHVTVALSGDGGDENFGGYRRYRLHLARGAVAPRAARFRCAARCSGFSASSIPKPIGHRAHVRAKSTFEALGRDSVEAYFQGVSILRDAMRQPLVHRCVQAEARRLQRRRGVPSPCALAPAPTTRSPSIQYLDLKTYLVGDINTKVDRASMAHSLEVREPLMDHPLVEWLATLPSSMKIHGQEGKWLLKKAMEPQVAARSPVPAEDGIRRAARAMVPRIRCASACATRCLANVLRARGLFDADPICEELVDHHQSGRRDYSCAVVDASDVRRLSAQRRGRVRRRRAAPRGRMTAPCAFSTSSITRFRRTAVIRFGLSPSCVNSARGDGRRCSSRRHGTALAPPT